jgi:hypothetical protein
MSQLDLPPEPMKLQHSHVEFPLRTIPWLYSSLAFFSYSHINKGMRYVIIERTMSTCHNRYNNEYLPFTIEGTLCCIFSMPKLMIVGHLNFPRTNFFAFSDSFALVFFPLPPSRHPLILFSLCLLTFLLVSGALTWKPLSTLGLKLQSPSSSINLP